MPKAILKFFLRDMPTEEPQMLPSGDVLHVGNQGSALVVWIVCEPDAPRDRAFMVAWTGQEPPPAPFAHVGTAVGPVIVNHVYAGPSA